MGCGGIARHVPPLQKKFSAPAEFDGYLMGEGAFHLAPSLGGTLLVFSYSHPQSLAHKASLSGFRFYTMSWAPSQHVLSWVGGAGGWSALRIAGKCIENHSFNVCVHSLVPIMLYPLSDVMAVH